MENAHKAKDKGQISMMVIVLGVVFFLMLGLFLFISSIKPQNDDFINLYVHNLLLASLRMHTGYGQPCLSVSDTLGCAYITPDRLCGGEKCSELAEIVAKGAIESVIRPDMDYLLIVEPENQDVMGGYRMEIGNPDLENRKKKFVANEKVIQYGLRIALILAKK